MKKKNNMTEIKGNPDNPVRIRRIIKNAAKAAMVDAPEKETPGEEMLIDAINTNTKHRKTAEGVVEKHESKEERIPNDYLNPIIPSMNSKDPRLREDKVEPSPLTPDQVADILSSEKDAETGMPKIPRNPKLMPWEGVSHQ